MIELKHDKLVFSFPNVHKEARLKIDFQRTLRIPDDDTSYPLPPGLGPFPLRHVDDFAQGVPADWLRHGGVMMPMYQSEALWLNFEPVYCAARGTAYPFAIRVATGRIDAVTGERWADGLSSQRQNYLVAPSQPWLDGYFIEDGIIRQFVAMPLGAGYTAEEQITGHAEHGGLQIAVYPMKREVFERRFPIRDLRRSVLSSEGRNRACAPPPPMGLAPGGRMRQEIYDDPFELTDWDTTHTSRCFVHITNSLVWQAITGDNPPHPAPTAKTYTDAGLPWFEYFSDATTLKPSTALKHLKSVTELGKEKEGVPLPENESALPERVVNVASRQQTDQVREGDFF